MNLLEYYLNNYPPQPPQYPPQLPAPGGYNPFNPYQGYDPNIDYVPWLPGRQGARFLPMAIIVGSILLCSCCSFLFGIVVGIELPGFLEPSPPPENNQEFQDPGNSGGFHWQVIYPNT